MAALKEQRMRKILLIFPNIYILTPHNYPTDLGALSAYVKQHGYDTRFFIARKLKDISKLRRVLEEYQPDVVGLTGIGSQAQYMKEMATIVKAWRNVPVICGGKHATLAPESLFEHPDFDVLCQGEGEQAFVEYLQALDNGTDPTSISNLWFHKENEIIRNPCRSFVKDLDSLPFYDYQAVDYQEMINFNSRWILLLAGRGCPYHCTFCGVPGQAKHGIGEFTRLRSVDHILSEIEMLQTNYSFDYIYFRDDTFTWNREWSMEWANEYPKRFSYPFEFLTRADCLDRELLDSLKKANCACIWLGADCGDDHIRNDVLKKDVSKERLIEMCDYMHHIGIHPHLTNMVGLPYETKETHQKTIDLNKRVYSKKISISGGVGPSPMIFVFSPFPGTPLWKLSKEEGWLKEQNHWKGFRTYRESVIDMPQFPRKLVYKALRQFRYKVYKDVHPFWALFMLFLERPFPRYLRNLPPVNWLYIKFLRLISSIFSKKKVDYLPQSRVAAEYKTK